MGFGDVDTAAANENQASEPLQSAAPAMVESPGQDPGLICGDGGADDVDNDSLSDAVENCLGTDPYSDDSDRDLLADDVELEGFEFNSQTWYLNPLHPDTNSDGLADVEEYASPVGNAPSWDPDGDNLPNPWDDDNDNDGVYDNLDLSPYSVTASKDAFSFTVQSEPDFNGFHYIDLQIRPEDPKHLRFSTDFHDWPDDAAGQIQDLDQSTEDLFFSPVLVVDTNQIPEDTLRDLYGVTVFLDESNHAALCSPAAY